MGLAQDATLDTIKGELIHLKGVRTENEVLKLRLQAIEEEKLVTLKAEAKTLIDTAISENRITAAQRPSYEQLFALSFDAAKTALGAIPKPIALSAVPAAQPGAEGKFTYQGKTFSQLSKDNSDLLMKLKANDFPTFNELYKAEYGTDYKVS